MCVRRTLNRVSAMILARRLQNAFCADAVGHRDAADDIISLSRRRAMIAPNHAENEADKDKLHIAHTARRRNAMRASRFMCHGRHPINSDWIDSDDQVTRR